ncbi:hypothetical protein [Mycobacterium hubeiense]|uniref:hypothetical protein n=1 Tax=Mycobacterium hubeiense TaxID=1867256 RepID=UPI00130400EF|nr:hypothetical protein [Mycobacterium sp. QGD 101]
MDIQSGDFEYDEAHDAMGTSQGASPTPTRDEKPPKVVLDPGGDYGYDEAHDFGA